MRESRHSPTTEGTLHPTLSPLPEEVPRLGGDMDTAPTFYEFNGVLKVYDSEFSSDRDSFTDGRTSVTHPVTPVPFRRSGGDGTFQRPFVPLERGSDRRRRVFQE